MGGWKLWSAYDVVDKNFFLSAFIYIFWTVSTSREWCFPAQFFAIVFTLHPAKLNFVLGQKREWNWDRVCLPENRWRARETPGVVGKREAYPNPFSVASGKNIHYSPGNDHQLIPSHNNLCLSFSFYFDIISIFSTNCELYHILSNVFLYSLFKYENPKSLYFVI